MAPKAAPSTHAPRRSARLAKDPTAALPVADTNRITKPAPPPKTPRLDCSSCDRSLAASAFFKRLPTATCKHDNHTCKQCLKTWIAMQLEATTYDKLSCPECAEGMQSADVKKVATKETYAKFDELERRAFADKMPGWRWCLAPKCRAGQVHAPSLEADTTEGDKAKAKKRAGRKKAAAEKEDVCICNECGVKACVACDRPYHDGETCAQYQKRVQRQKGEEEEASRATIEKECQQCPNTKCGKKIEKDGGCDQVTCSQCWTSFCWLCSTAYSVINKSGHAEGCTYAQPNRFDPHAAPNAPGDALPGLPGNAVGGGGGFGAIRHVFGWP